MEPVAVEPGEDCRGRTLASVPRITVAMVRTGARPSSIPTIDLPDKLTWPRYIKVMPTTIAAKASS
jgi:hypothetical protein